MNSPQMSTSIWLAWKDWKHETALTVCAVLALASMLIPVLVLLGLKNGLIQEMRVRLLENPAVLNIEPKSDAGRFKKDFIASLAQVPGALFAIPRTRVMGTDVTFLNPLTGRSVSIVLEPAAPGEPLLGRAGLASPENSAVPEIVLSQVAADSLGVKVGSELVVNLGRITPPPNRRRESRDLPFKVSGILPTDMSDRKLGFVSLNLLQQMQDYRDYLAVPERGFEGNPPPAEREYASFRLYAKNLESVGPLVEKLQAQNIETTSQARDIARMRSLEAAINNIILVISVVMGAGFTAFTFSSVQGSVSRKKRQLAILRLFGLKRLALFIFPLTQVLLTAVTGFILSLAVYLAVARAIQTLFRSQANLSPHLTWPDMGWVGLLVLFLSVIGCFRAAWKGASVEPSSLIREN